MKARIAILTLAALAACSSCSDDKAERTYTVPEDFCGLEVSEEVVAPLYPPGEGIRVEPFEVRETGFMSPLTRCVIEVDGEIALDVRVNATSTRGMGPTIADFLAYEGLSDRDIGAAERPADADDFLVWPDYGALHIDCGASPGLDFTGMTLGIGLDWAGGDQDLSEQISEAMRPVMDEFLTRLSPGTCDRG